MADQCISYKRHNRYFLQRKKDLWCWQKTGQWWEIIVKYRTAFKCAASPGTSSTVTALWASCQLSLRNGHDKKPASLFHWHLASRDTCLVGPDISIDLLTSILNTSSSGSAHCPMTEKGNSSCISILSFTPNSSLYRRTRTGTVDFNLLAVEVDGIPSVWF